MQEFVWQGSDTPVIITRSVDLPSDNTFDDISIQTLESDDKETKAVGIYQESRRGALDSEIVHHEAHMVATGVFDIVVAALDACGDVRKITKDHPQYQVLRSVYESLIEKNGMPVLKA